MINRHIHNLSTHNDKEKTEQHTQHKQHTNNTEIHTTHIYKKHKIQINTKKQKTIYHQNIRTQSLYIQLKVNSNE